MKPFLLFATGFLSAISAAFGYVSISGYYPTLDQFPYAGKFQFNDMAYGKGTLAMLEYQHLYLLNSLEDEPVVVQLPEFGEQLEFGNGVFVISGQDGFLASSRDLRSWTYFVFRNGALETIEDVAEFDAEETPADFSKLLFSEGQFHALTDDLEYLVSEDGVTWNVVGTITEDAFPVDPKVSSTDLSQTFTSNGKKIRFEYRTDTSRTVYELQDSGEWLATGVFSDSSFTGSMGLDNEVLIHSGTDWMGLHDGIFFEKKDGIWKIYNLLDSNGSFGFRSVDFARVRQDQAIYIGSKIDGLYRSKDGQLWEKLDVDLDVEMVRFIPENGFFLIENVYDSDADLRTARVYLTLFGDDPKLVFERERFTISDVVQMGLQAVITGITQEDESEELMVIRKSLPLEYDYLPAAGEIVWEDYLDGIDMDSTLNQEGYVSVPHVVGGNDYSRSDPESGILATRTKVYFRDGESWVETLEVPEYSWITCAYFYRQQYFIGTTNFVRGTRVYVGPPDGVDALNQLYYSTDGVNWEVRELDFQPLLDHPSTDGPQLIESVNSSLNVTWKYEAEEGPDLTATRDMLPNSTHYLWGKGKYLAYRDYSSEISPFLGFKDSWYHWFKSEDALGNVTGSTRGWFGSLDPTNYPVLDHNMFGEVTFEIEANDDIYLTSDRFGVLKTSRSDVPYFTSLADGITYYVAFIYSYTPFYNHSTGQWVDAMECESFDYERWYEVCHDQTVKIQQVATDTVVAVQAQDVMQAYELLQQTKREYKTLQQFVKMGKALEAEAAGTNPTYQEWPISNASFDALSATALEAVTWASGYYDSNI